MAAFSTEFQRWPAQDPPLCGLCTQPVGKERGKGKEGVKSGALRGFSNFDVKPLEESDNAWKPATKSKEDVDALEKLLRTTKGLLNKFTPEKFEKLTDQFLELEITCRTDMIAIIDLGSHLARHKPARR